MTRPPGPDNLAPPPAPDVQVRVQATHSPDFSAPNRQTFVYRVTIENRSGETWQLMARHWDIQDGSGQRFTVDGEGVVGEQPLLAPEAVYIYESFVSVEALPGFMVGHYLLRNAWGYQAKVPIPVFRLDVEPGGGERLLN